MTAQAIEIQEPPPMDIGAPLPAVSKWGSSLLVAYICRNPEFPGWDSGASPDHSGFEEYCAVLEFIGVDWYILGAPSDERQHEHPLYGHGLTFYGFHEIVESEKTSGTNLRHWIITFHDETLEVTANDMKVRSARVNTGSPEEAIRRISEPSSACDSKTCGF